MGMKPRTEATIARVSPGCPQCGAGTFTMCDCPDPGIERDLDDPDDEDGIEDNP